MSLQIDLEAGLVTPGERVGVFHNFHAVGSKVPHVDHRDVSGRVEAVALPLVDDRRADPLLRGDAHDTVSMTAIVVGGGVPSGSWLLPRVIERVSAWLAPSCQGLAGAIFPSALDPQKVGLLDAAAYAFLRIDGS